MRFFIYLLVVLFLGIIGTSIIENIKDAAVSIDGDAIVSIDKTKSTEISKTKSTEIASSKVTDTDMRPRWVMKDETTDIRYIAMIHASMENLKARLRDPSSAQFRMVYLNSSDDGTIATCGQVNSMNGSGGYSGFQKFVAAPVRGLAFLEDDLADREFKIVFDSLCH